MTMRRPFLAFLICGAAGLGPALAHPLRAPAAPASTPAVGIAVAPAIAAPPPNVAAPAQPKTPPAPIRISSDPRPSYTPGTFVATLRAAERYLALAQAGGWPALPADLTEKLGDSSPGVARLRERLAISGDLDPAFQAGDLYDGALAAALSRFQFRHGLPETGLPGPRTLAALNVPAAARHRQLAASARRLMGSAFAFGERYVAVNIPSATVEAVEAGRVARRYVAVVGKPDRASPTVETRITAVNLNPTWTVPVSLIRRDIIPHMRKDPSYLASMKIRVLDGQGLEIDSASIDWTTEKAVNFTLRQDPGAGNSLGQVRIDMPNRQAVYMHDTPSKRLFAQTTRFHSSGCVRVAGVNDLAAWLLEGTIGPDGAWNAAAIGAGIATGRRQDVRLVKPVPVAWIYMTGYAMADGSVHFRDDIYGFDSLEPAPVAPTPDVATTASIVPRPR